MDKTQPVPIFLPLLALVALLTLLPPPHPEARLFSDGWGAESFVDPDICLTPLDGQPARLLLFPKAPVGALALDRLVLAAQYLAWGLLLPIAALLATLRFAAHHPVLLSFGLLGLVPAYFQWPLNPAFVDLRQWLAEAWIARWPLLESQYVWLDGIALFVWLAGGTALAGGAIFLAVAAAARLVGLDGHRLAGALAPLAGSVVFLGLTQTTALYLRGEGVGLDWLPYLRAALLTLALGTSSWLAMRSFQKVGAGGTALLWLVPLVLTALHGWAMYFHWTGRYHV